MRSLVVGLWSSAKNMIGPLARAFLLWLLSTFASRRPYRCTLPAPTLAGPLSSMFEEALGVPESSGAHARILAESPSYDSHPQPATESAKLILSPPNLG
jgi:hypothetical protein